MHSSDHELWYAALATGERDLPRGALAELERCNVCADRVSDLDAVRARLDRAATEQREVLSEARGAFDAPGAAAAEQRLRAAIATGDRARRRRIWPMVAAAAALIAVAIAMSALIDRGPSPSPGVRGVLGESPFTALSPRDTWPASTPLVWRYPLPQGGWYVVRLHEPERPKAFAESTR